MSASARWVGPKLFRPWGPCIPFFRLHSTKLGGRDVGVAQRPRLLWAAFETPGPGQPQGSRAGGRGLGSPAPWLVARVEPGRGLVWPRPTLAAFPREAQLAQPVPLYITARGGMGSGHRLRPAACPDYRGPRWRRRRQQQSFSGGGPGAHPPATVKRWRRK